jgi:hypothetical protein
MYRLLTLCGTLVLAAVACSGCGGQQEWQSAAAPGPAPAGQVVLPGTSFAGACHAFRVQVMPSAQLEERGPQTGMTPRMTCTYSSHRLTDLAGLQVTYRSQDGLYLAEVYITSNGHWVRDTDENWNKDAEGD